MRMRKNNKKKNNKNKKKKNILLSGLSIFSFFFYDFNLNTQGFVYLEIVKYQLGLHRNVQVFVKCNVCISAIQLFYIQTFPGFFPISKSYIFPMLGSANTEYWSPYYRTFPFSISHYKVTTIGDSSVLNK